MPDSISPEMKYTDGRGIMKSVCVVGVLFAISTGVIERRDF
jgi:hypothetical protein